MSAPVEDLRLPAARWRARAAVADVIERQERPEEPAAIDAAIAALLELRELLPEAAA